MSAPNSEALNYKFQDKTEKLCPFRKRTNAFKTFISSPNSIVISSSADAEWTEEEFLPCLKEKCQAWHTTTYEWSYCGLTIK